MDNGDAGRRGEASLKNAVVLTRRRGWEGERKGLNGDCGDRGKVGESGGYGSTANRGDASKTGETGVSWSFGDVNVFIEHAVFNGYNEVDSRTSWDEVAERARHVCCTDVVSSPC